jgi:hypothetical protein
MSKKNLYKIKLRHCSPKDYADAIKIYVIAKNDEEVFNHINKNYVYHSWTEDEEYTHVPELETKEGKYLTFDTYKEYIMAAKGDWEDEKLYRDLYYGATLHAWDLVKENLSAVEVEVLKNTKVATELNL